MQVTKPSAKSAKKERPWIYKETEDIRKVYSFDKILGRCAELSAPIRSTALQLAHGRCPTAQPTGKCVHPSVRAVYLLCAGKGQFGTTRLAIHRETGEKLACKSISKRKLNCQEDIDDVRR